MYIKPCPKCGRLPVIDECIPYKKGTRRYMVYCPNHCSVILDPDQLNFPAFNHYFMIETTDADYNYMYKQWNDRTTYR